MAISIAIIPETTNPGKRFMTTYSVAEAKNRLPSLIDKALQGEEVIITRHGRPVAELRARRQINPETARAATERLLARSHPSVGMTSVELLNVIYEDDPEG
jgi:antitoxin (DNA-binding transcriptional repressor) of toxin-antitoxin stability system